MTSTTINNVRIHYRVSREGPAATLLHGYTGSHQDWAHQIPLLSKRYQVVALDYRGHGKSEAPSAARGYSIELLIQDVRGLLRHLSIPRSCIVGHSMGGFIALELALKYADMVSALVLVDTSSGEFERVPGFAELRARLDELARSEGMEAAFEYNAAHNPLAQQQFERHPELRQVSRQKMLQTSVDGYVFTWRAISEWKPVTERLSEIKVPTLIVVGEEDTPFHRPSQIMKESIANSRLEIIPGVGHSPHEEAADAFNEVLMDFLAGLHLGG